MPREPRTEGAPSARRLLAQRASRVRRIRRNIVASGLATFVLAFALVAESGSFGSVGAATASPAGQSSANVAASVASDDDSYDDDYYSQAQDNSTRAAVSPVTTSQS